MKDKELSAFRQILQHILNPKFKISKVVEPCKKKSKKNEGAAQSFVKIIKAKDLDQYNRE